METQTRKEAAVLGIILMMFLIILSPAIQAIVVHPGPHFRPLPSNSDYQYYSIFHFNRIEVAPTEAIFDGFHFQFWAPSPRMFALITVLEYGRDVAWRGTYTNQTEVWLNVTGLAPDTTYSFIVDGQVLANPRTNSIGHLEQSFVDWAGVSTHDFRYVPAGFIFNLQDWLLVILFVILVIFLILAYILDEPLLVLGAAIIAVIIAWLVFLRTGDFLVSMLILAFAIVLAIWALALIFWHRRHDKRLPRERRWPRNRRNK